MREQNEVLSRVKNDEIIDGQYNIPAGVTVIGSQAFSQRSDLIAITIPKHVRSIERFACCACKNLRSVNIEAEGIDIGEYVFGVCPNLATINIAAGLRAIKANTFRACTNLTTVTLPEEVNYIGNSAFYGCTKLAAINIPKGVTAIDAYAFYNCPDLTVMTIPAGITTIHPHTFGGDEVFKGSEPAYIFIDTQDEANYERIKKLFPEHLQKNITKTREFVEKGALLLKSYKGAGFFDAHGELPTDVTTKILNDLAISHGLPPLNVAAVTSHLVAMITNSMQEEKISPTSSQSKLQ